MAHKTLINGTAYEVKGGRTLVNGTGYSIKSGRTLVNGTGYGVTFATPEDLVDELFTTITYHEHYNTGSSNAKVHLPAVNNSYYLAGGHFGKASVDGFYLGLYYYAGGSLTYPLWFVGTGEQIPLYLDGSELYPDDPSTSTMGDGASRGQIMLRVSFGVSDPAARLSLLTLFSQDNDGTSDKDYLWNDVYTGSGANINRLPSYHIYAGSGGFAIGKYNGGTDDTDRNTPSVVTVLFNHDDAQFHAKLVVNSYRVCYSGSSTGYTYTTGMIAGFHL